MELINGIATVLDCDIPASHLKDVIDTNFHKLFVKRKNKNYYTSTKSIILKICNCNSSFIDKTETEGGVVKFQI